MNQSYKAVIFDIGNVLFHISMQNALHYWSIQTGLNYTTLQSRFSFDDAHKNFERGNLSANEYRLHIQSMIQTELTPTVFFNGWNMIYLDTFPEIENIIVSLKKNYTVAALSNTNITHKDIWSWKYKSLISKLDYVFASHEIGHIKPDASSYNYVLNELNVKAEEAIFFDDKLENVEGAKAVGIQAIQVTSPIQMYEAMKNEGLTFDLDWQKVKK